jgi:hypothetical protein
LIWGGALATGYHRLCVHLVGSVPLADAETVFLTVCASIGPHLRRLPDGETGARRRWVGMISEILDRHPALETDPDEPPFVMKLASGAVHRELRRLRFRAGIDPKTVRFETGYAAMAIDSFAIFDRLQRDGVIPKAVKFQIAIPSPLAPAYNYISKKHRTAFLDVFAAHLPEEVHRIAAVLPNDRLAIQWDILQEILIWENYFPDRPDDYQTQITSVLSKVGNAVPQAIELGYHLCYGSPKDEHLVQPRDAAIMVAIMNETVRQVQRPITYFHIPVPKDRTDATFYRPLSALSLSKGTELFVGLVHLNDDDGNRQRLDMVRKFAAVAGVASECGWGRGDPSRVGALLDTLQRLVGAQSAPV